MKSMLSLVSFVVLSLLFSTASLAGSGEGWYWGLQPPQGAPFWVGPYKTDFDCADMYGSCIYAHPWGCHLGLPECQIIGNGFCYPESYPYPVPSTEIIAGNLNCEQMSNEGNPYFLKKGWYFVFYTLSGGYVIGASTAAACGQLYDTYNALAKTVPGDEIGYYSDARCAGAPCFSVGTDTACE